MSEEELPPGFRYVRVLVSDREYHNLYHSGALLAEGTPGAAFRRAAGWSTTPYRFKSSLRRLREEKEEKMRKDEGTTT